MLRAGYRTTARLFRNSDEEVGIRWYRCAPGAPVLGYPSQLRPLLWQSHPYLYTDKGEVFNADTEFRAFKPIPGANGQEPCGTREDFARGGVYDPDAEPAVYTPEGLSLCCGGLPGGLVLGGEPPDLDGGLLLGGVGLQLQYFQLWATCAGIMSGGLPPDGSLCLCQTLGADQGSPTGWRFVIGAGAPLYYLTVSSGQTGTVRVFTGNLISCAANVLFASWSIPGTHTVALPPLFPNPSGPIYRVQVDTTPDPLAPVIMSLGPTPP